MIPAIPCNLCGSLSCEKVSNRDRNRNALQTVICTACGLVWTDPRPEEKATRKFYREDYRVQYKASYVPKLKHVVRETQRAIERYQFVKPLLVAKSLSPNPHGGVQRPGKSEPSIGLEMCSKSQLLDVGSGGGFFLYVAKQQGIEGQGIEPNEGFAGYANNTLGVPTTNGFLQDLDFSGQNFDVITLNHVLEHVEDPLGTIARLKNWLRPDGHLVVEVPNVEATYHAPQNRFHIGHLYNFSLLTLEELGVKAGLRVAKSQWVTPEQHLHVIFCNAPAQESCSAEKLRENYQRVAASLAKHTRWKHYGSVVPYARFLQKQAQYLQERRQIRGKFDPKAIVEELIAAHGDAPTRFVA